VRLVLLLLLLLLLGVSGCAATATIVTPQGTFEAAIHGGDEESLVVTNDAGLKRRVRREDVMEIDHPGNVLATVFGIAGGVFTLELGVFAGTGLCGTSPSGSGVAPCIAVGSLAMASLTLFAVGLWQWVSSRNAVFNPPAPSEGDITKVPFIRSRPVPPAPEDGPAPLPPPPPPSQGL
jgi:hypothetical protein